MVPDIDGEGGSDAGAEGGELALIVGESRSQLLMRAFKEID